MFGYWTGDKDTQPQSGDEVSSPPGYDTKTRSCSDNDDSFAGPSNGTSDGPVSPRDKIRRGKSADDVSANDCAKPSGPRSWDDDDEKAFLEGLALTSRRVWEEVDASPKGRLQGEVKDRFNFFPADSDEYPDAEENTMTMVTSKEVLEAGGSVYAFCCRPVDQLKQDEKMLADAIVNMTCFEDEVRDNNVPHVNVFDDEDGKKYIAMLNHCAYMLPGVKLSDMTPELLSNYEYQKNSQTASAFVWDDVTEPLTFRITKTIIRFVFSVTIQLRCSRIDERDLPMFSRLMGVRVEGGILMERTKRSSGKQDATAKTKSVLLYTQVDGGLLVHNLTLILNTQLPTVVAKLVNNLGRMGVDEVDETAAQTRAYLRQRFGL